METVKFPEPSRKRKHQYSQGSQYDLLASDCRAEGNYEGGHVTIYENPARYLYYYFGGFFGTPVPRIGSRTEPENDMLQEDNVADVKHRRLPISDFVFDGHLLLTLEESFYLAFALELLTIRIDNKVCDLAEIWQKFCSADPKFIGRYIVYHNFRSKNWVVRSGLKLGSEFLLYKDGPPYYHASYVVKIHEVLDGSREKGAFKTWTEMACLNRVVNQVVKELIVCHLIWPDKMTKEQVYKSPESLSKFDLQEVLVRRWVAAEDRELEND